jgi:translation initiation factor 2B subunit (eIF-2B alpha/beta/delta family)
MLSNGYLLGSVGTSLIACIAYNFKKPVIAFSETYKFWDKIQMNTFQPSNIKLEKIDNKVNIIFLKYNFIS